MQDDTRVTTDRKVRLTAAETIAMLEAAGIEVPKRAMTSVRIDGMIDRAKYGTGPDSYVTTVSIRDVPAALPWERPTTESDKERDTHFSAERDNADTTARVVARRNRPETEGTMRS